jgi:hypothetical protein
MHVSPPPPTCPPPPHPPWGTAAERWTHNHTLPKRVVPLNEYEVQIFKQRDVQGVLLRAWW